MYKKYTPTKSISSLTSRIALLLSSFEKIIYLSYLEFFSLF